MIEHEREKTNTCSFQKQSRTTIGIVLRQRTDIKDRSTAWCVARRDRIVVSTLALWPQQPRFESESRHDLRVTRGV